MIHVEIDRNSGFCGGVIRAIGTAERYLSEHEGGLYSLGAIVHNEEELARLEALGLVTVGLSGLCGPSGCGPSGCEAVLVRAHGEPPQVYDRLGEAGFRVIDCTCPVVLKLQRDIRAAYEGLHGSGGSLLIYGKEGHPEVLGLVGQVGGDVAVVQNTGRLAALVGNGALRTDRDIELFSQTTMSPDGYAAVRAYLEPRMRDGAELRVHDTICSQVASRHRELAAFAGEKDVIVFVSGRSSSNGKVLCEMCRRENPRTHHIGSVGELRPEWFRDGDRAGVCGATSTPKWLLENVASAIENLQ